MEPKLYTPEQAAQILEVGRSKLYELLANGSIKSIKIGRCRRIPARCLDDFVEEQTGQGRVQPPEPESGEVRSR